MFRAMPQFKCSQAAMDFCMRSFNCCKCLGHNRKNPPLLAATIDIQWGPSQMMAFEKANTHACCLQDVIMRCGVIFT
jgi:hypothetical protein